MGVAPVRERGLKLIDADNVIVCAHVAPARERGLKLIFRRYSDVTYSRSREGAWIEIKSITAWTLLRRVAPVRERGLKSLCLLR